MTKPKISLYNIYSGTFPFDVWDDMKNIYGKKFLMPEDIAGYEVKYDGAVRFLEYEDGTRVEGV